MKPAGAERRALQPLWMIANGAVIGAGLSTVAFRDADPCLGGGVLVVGAVLVAAAVWTRRCGMLWFSAGLAVTVGRGLQTSVRELEVDRLIADQASAAIRIEARIDSGWEPTRWGQRATVRLRSARRGEHELELARRWRLEVRGAAGPDDLPEPGCMVASLASVRGDGDHPFLVVDSPAMMEVRAPPAGVAELRDRLAHSLLAAAGTDFRRIRSAELAAALALGRRDLLTADRREGWRRSGMAHLLAVSGLHVGTVAAILWLLLAAADLHPRRVRWVMLVAVPAYAVIAGASPSAVRAALMGVVYLAGRQLGRSVIPMATVLSVTVVLLVAEPSLVTEAGFQLTVLVTASLVRWVPTLSRRLPGPRWLAGGLAVPLVAQLGASPIIAHHFRSAVPGAVLANLLLPLLIAPGLAVALVATSVAPLWPAAGGLMLDGLGLVERLLWTCGRPGRAVDLVLPAMPVAVTAVFALAGWAALQPGRRARLGAAAWIAALGGMALWWSVRPEPATTGVDLLPVGDGLAAVVSSPEGSVLVDAGRWRREAAELLADHGIRRLGAVAISHADEDHFGGAEAVLMSVRVDRLLVPRWMLADGSTVSLLRAARRRGVAVTPVTRGSVVRAAGASLEVLWPPFAGEPVDENERGLIFRAVGPGGAVLLTSDIGRKTELRIAGSSSLASDVLVVPHHGSRNSACSALLDRVAPLVALIPAGPLNRFHHPHQEVLDRLEARGIPYRYPKRDGLCGAAFDGRAWVLHPDRSKITD